MREEDHCPVNKGISFYITHGEPPVPITCRTGAEKKLMVNYYDNNNDDVTKMFYIIIFRLFDCMVFNAEFNHCSVTSQRFLSNSPLLLVHLSRNQCVSHNDNRSILSVKEGQPLL